MFHDLPTFVQLLKGLQQIPYLASKNLYRVAEHFLNMDEQQTQQFCTLLLEAKKNLRKCSICFCWKEKERTCSFCDSPKRNAHIVCVIESWQELFSIEKTGGYDGVYHVLGGAICPLEGIGQEDLTIEPLIKRVKETNVTEVILATNQTPEGEATAAYIAKKLQDTSVVVSCLARGLPVGSSLETMDRITVYKALSERRPF